MKNQFFRVMHAGYNGGIRAINAVIKVIDFVLRLVRAVLIALLVEIFDWTKHTVVYSLQYALRILLPIAGTVVIYYMIIVLDSEFRSYFGGDDPTSFVRVIIAMGLLFLGCFMVHAGCAPVLLRDATASFLSDALVILTYAFILAFASTLAALVVDHVMAWTHQTAPRYSVGPIGRFCLWVTPLLFLITFAISALWRRRSPVVD